MTLRTTVDWTVKAGLNGSTAPGDLIVDRSLSEIADSLGHGTVAQGSLTPGEVGRELTLEPISQIRLLLVQATCDLNLVLGGLPATPAVLAGDVLADPLNVLPNASYFEVTTVAGAFQITFDGLTPQTLTDIANQINAAGALVGAALPVASVVGGALQLTSVVSGEAQTVSVASDDPQTLVDLGFTGATSAQGTDAGTNSDPIYLRKLVPSDSNSAQAYTVYFLATVMASKVYLTNPTQDPCTFFVFAAGDLVTDSDCPC